MDNKNKLLRVFFLLVFLAIAWLLWSGFFKPLLLGLGLFSCILCVFLAHRIGFFNAVTGLHLIPGLPRYWAWLLIEIVKSSFQVAKIILSPKLPISPTVVEIDAAAKGPIGQVVLGNSITLTPGTVTFDVHEGKLMVHCLTTEGANDIQSGEMNRRVAKLTSS